MSTIKVDTIQDTSGNEQFTAKAWVNFNGSGTVAIRADGNVSSLTDNGTGDFTVNFTSTLTDADYAVGPGTAGQIGVADVGGFVGVVRTDGSEVPLTKSTSAVRMGFGGGVNQLRDVKEAYVGILR